MLKEEDSSGESEHWLVQAFRTLGDTGLPKRVDIPMLEVVYQDHLLVLHQALSHASLSSSFMGRGEGWVHLGLAGLITFVSSGCMVDPAREAMLKQEWWTRQRQEAEAELGLRKAMVYVSHVYESHTPRIEDLQRWSKWCQDEAGKGYFGKLLDLPPPPPPAISPHVALCSQNPHTKPSPPPLFPFPLLTPL